VARYAGLSRVQLRGPAFAPLRAVPVDPAAFNHVTHEILGAAIEVHRTIGPGLLESIYLQLDGVKRLINPRAR